MKTSQRHSCCANSHSKEELQKALLIFFDSLPHKPKMLVFTWSSEKAFLKKKWETDMRESLLCGLQALTFILSRNLQSRNPLWCLEIKALVTASPGIWASPAPGLCTAGSSRCSSSAENGAAEVGCNQTHQWQNLHSASVHAISALFQCNHPL